jgi:putative pyruvate formate lyase activating enzyme
MKRFSYGCVLCGRRCKVNREKGEKGFCGIGDKLRLAQAVIHQGEEPPLSGAPPGGSGALFFSQCNLSCVYCQNYQISQNKSSGTEISEESLVEFMFALKARGAYNINLVSPTPYVFQIAKSLSKAKDMGLDLPIIYNSGGYDSLEALSVLEGLIDIYLPDAKMAAPKNAKEGDPDGRSMRIMGVGDYPWVNYKAILEMYRQVGNLKVNEEGLATKGLIIRHLVLPDNIARTRELLLWIKDNIGEETVISLMAQYFPTNRIKVGFNPEFRDYPGLGRPLSVVEYEVYVNDLINLNLRNAFIQDLEAASIYKPDFSKPDAFN